MKYSDEKFTTSYGFEYNNIESVFKFVRLNFLSYFMTEEYLKSFSWNTNLTTVGTLDYILDRKNEKVEFIPEPTPEELDRIIYDKLDRLAFNALTPAAKAIELDLAKVKYFNSYTKENGESDEKFVKHERRMSISIKQILEDDSWTFDKHGRSDSYGPMKFFENNFAKIQLMRKRNRYNCTIVFTLKELTELLELTSLLYDKIDTNSYFSINSKYKHKINIPNTFISLIKTLHNLTDDETFNYLQDFASSRIFSERDMTTGELKNLFTTFNTTPLLRVTSLSQDEKEKTLTMEFELEVNMPREISVYTNFSRQSITPVLFSNTLVSISDIKNITDTMEEAEAYYVNRKILKLDYKYLLQYQVELNITTAQLDNIRAGLAFVVIDTTNLNQQDLDFVEKYSSFDYTLDEVELTTKIDKHDEYIVPPDTTVIVNVAGDTYNYLKSIYYNDHLPHSEFRIHDDTVQLHLDNDFAGVTAKIAGFEDSEVVIEERGREFWIVLPQTATVTGFTEVTFFLRA